MSFWYAALIEYHPQIARTCEMTTYLPCVGAHSRPPVLITYELDIQGRYPVYMGVKTDIEAGLDFNGAFVVQMGC